MSVAVPYWEIVATKESGATRLYVRGPETHASVVAIPQDATFFGIQFSLGTSMAGAPLVDLVDSAIVLPTASRRTVLLNGEPWEIPTFDNADTFVARLVRKGLLVHDPLVSSRLRGESSRRVSLRSMQRRILRSTGLAAGTIRQIARAERAVALLESGVGIVETVAQAGYADQPHLTRSLRRFVGESPAAIRASSISRELVSCNSDM